MLDRQRTALGTLPITGAAYAVFDSRIETHVGRTRNILDLDRLPGLEPPP
jgi:hypothetical protein